MFHWSRPCALEEFLLPPRGGVDWRLPEWMARHLPSATIYYDEDDLPKLLQDNRTFPTNTLLSGLLSLFRGDNTIVTNTSDISILTISNNKKNDLPTVDNNS